ncbi:SDR family oxidoreductase [Sphingobium algorifonticola]|uniref:Peroxisomal trans-2-enoyl-CoA reductase n=1 Tax=Sphingobium algorifonticola TaxID=2008318 RepID=A0A437JDI7_9SPHN|nr:SDR family oxidoreductase [Sphingobium algorifonticola]RVT43803.1 SDR family oxidoreductase [Sphingobium algorifonticola]
MNEVPDMANFEQAGAPRPKFGFTESELAAMPTVYREDLLAGQVVLISGGGSGIGKGLAFLAARLGADVIICGRRAEKLETTADAIERHVGKRPLPVSMSIREPEEVDALFDRIYTDYGRLDHLVNNAGGQFPQDAIDFSRKGWMSVIDLNLNGTWWMMQAAAQRWREAGSGGNIVSVVANVERGMPQAAHTCAARAGVIYLSKTLATEWAPHNIRVNCVAPGVIESEGFHVYPEEALARFHDANPMKRRGDVWDVAEAVVYLMAPSGKFITGDLLVIDGGQAQNGAVWPAGRPDYFGGKAPNGV